jgi:4,5-dihydroxyphthalate decarboxylase
MRKITLTIATTDYDHFRDFRTGAVAAEGIEHTWLTLGHHEIFLRFTFGREWDVSELSFAKFTAQVTREDPDIIGLPVFASRLFRFGSFYVNRNSGIKTAADLKGKSIGSPEWAHTAAVYMRGWLAHEAGVKLSDVHWYQAGANEAGRIEKVELNLPKGMTLTRIAERSLSDMLAAGEIDCALIARPPNSFLEGHPDVVRLFPNFLELEEEYYAKTRVFPIMHVIAVKRELLKEHAWIARNLYTAFNESKRRSLERLYDPAVSRYPLPWLPTYARRMRDLFGGDPFPFGIEENRPTLELFLQYTFEQGIAHRHAKPEEIFPRGIMEAVKI